MPSRLQQYSSPMQSLLRECSGRSVRHRSPDLSCPHRRLLPAAILLLALCAPGLAQAKLDLALERSYAGVYSNACGDRNALSLKFYDDLMMVERGGRSVTANRIRARATHAGAAGAPDFKTVIVGDVKGGDGLAFVLYHNADGLFAVIDGGAQSLAPLGAGVLRQRLRHCDPNRNALPGAAVAKGPQAPFDLLRDARFKSGFNKAFGAFARERWVARLEGPAPELKQLTFDGVQYTLASVCKPHDCGDNNLVLLYGREQGTVFGLVQQHGRKTTVGDPSPAMARELDRLWQAEWRGP